jgi:hypothetical protein
MSTPPTRAAPAIAGGHAPTLRDFELSGMAIGANRESIGSIASRLRRAASKPLSSDRSASAISQACSLWRDSNHQRRRGAISQISANSGLSEALLAESLDAVLLPFSAQALEAHAAKVKSASGLIGFVMPGNVAAAGLHEFVQALIAGRAVLVKCASSEPVFFSEFARTIAELDPELAARVSVLAFGRENRELTRAMQENCDAMVVLGDDDTIDLLSRSANVIGFGSRVSGALLSREAVAPDAIDPVSEALARDITLFEQRGCLSPHHVFVESAGGIEAHQFAERLALSLEQLARRLPPPRAIDLGAAAAIRSVREAARWRKLGGSAVDLWESNEFAWSVIYDSICSFRISPLYRTVFVTPVGHLADFTARLEPVSGRLEAFAIADPERRLEEERAWLRTAGVSYFAAPGMMQSPPLDWPHGGSVFLNRLSACR